MTFHDDNNSLSLTGMITSTGNDFSSYNFDWGFFSKFS